MIVNLWQLFWSLATGLLKSSIKLKDIVETIMLMALTLIVNQNIYGLVWF